MNGFRGRKIMVLVTIQALVVCSGCRFVPQVGMTPVGFGATVTITDDKGDGSAHSWANPRNPLDGDLIADFGITNGIVDQARRYGEPVDYWEVLDHVKTDIPRY